MIPYQQNTISNSGDLVAPSLLAASTATAAPSVYNYPAYHPPRQGGATGYENEMTTGFFSPLSAANCAGVGLGDPHNSTATMMAIASMWNGTSATNPGAAYSAAANALGDASSPISPYYGYDYYYPDGNHQYYSQAAAAAAAHHQNAIYSAYTAHPHPGAAYMNSHPHPMAIPPNAYWNTHEEMQLHNGVYDALTEKMHRVTLEQNHSRDLNASSSTSAGPAAAAAVVVSVTGTSSAQPPTSVFVNSADNNSHHNAKGASGDGGGGGNKSWASIAGLAPRGSAATLGNSIVQGHLVNPATWNNGFVSESNNTAASSTQDSHHVRAHDQTKSYSVNKPRDSNQSSQNYNRGSTTTSSSSHGHHHSQVSDHSLPAAAAYCVAPPPLYFNNQPTNSVSQQQQQYDSSLMQTTTTATSSPMSEKILKSLQMKLNPKNFDINSIQLARVFVIKSYSEDDVHRSIKYGVWCSTERGNERLNEAYLDMQERGGKLFLCFSVNSSGHFCGVCEMTSCVDRSKRAGIWSDPRWRGEMKVDWIFVKDIPNNDFRHIRSAANENKPVPHSRDCTEVTPQERALQLLQVFANYSYRSSLLDDFMHYEAKEIANSATRVSPSY